MRKEVSTTSRTSAVTLIAVIFAMLIVTEVFLVEHAPPFGISDWKALRLSKAAIRSHSQDYSAVLVHGKYFADVFRDHVRSKIVVRFFPLPHRDGNGNYEVTMNRMGKILKVEAHSGL